ncbi:DNA polymerase III subunit alpha [Sinimarinibacterium sp. CAU 1509]|uniref:DNA polymerase III subunit alpha n=1 Tax=Sinimarinibacterium sp. CAU 1509 TaxID=2562283 RepID=UPI0010AD51CA|nr:DNA polymerase III subunit alpha [Sinimarinibacterium sp. CAU 1509]TJY62095.1 DNA polymerase III subunit alpha [Sinimarinibacterium sp. CAU 1509]
MTGFVHLRLHTEYSLIDGIVRVEPPKRKGGGAGATLISRTAELGFPAVAITDRNNLFAMVKFYKSAESAGIKPIVGVDIWLEERIAQDSPERLTLLVQNEAGYRNLARLISLGYTDGQGRGQPLISWDNLRTHADGLLALTGRDGGVFRAALADQVEPALEALDVLHQIFPQRLYLEIARCNRIDDEDWVSAACALSRKTTIPVVATNDVRFLERSEFDAHEARVCISQGRVLADEKRPRDYTPEQYLKSDAEMAALFADLPEALANSVEIARRCSLTLKFAPPYHLPNFPVPDGYTTDTWLRQRANEGLRERFDELAKASGLAGSEDDYRQRLDYELGIIEKMGFAGYFLVVSDFIQWAKTHGCPVGPGRGSGAGSLVAYAIRITDLDPLPYNLLFERFLNPERVSMPDFDVDFCMDNRDRVIEYVTHKYGRPHVGQIITYATMAARGVIRDVARVLGHGYGFADSIAKLVPGTPGATLVDALETMPELKRRYDQEEDTRAVIDMGLALEGVTRGVGVHAGGVVIAPQPLSDYTPMYCEPGGGGMRTQFDMKDLEAVGLVKFDFLGLKTLTVIEEAIVNIEKRHGLRLDALQLPLNDPETYALYTSGNTGAVFQMESPGMQRASRDLKPDRFEDIIALVSLYRPGPMDQIPEFCARKRGEFQFEYQHPDMESVLAPTYGIFVYQEQVMQMSQRLAGYTLGGADLLRRAMGKKKAEEMAKQREIFEQGAADRGIAADVAREVFDLMEKFANYGFNKSHAAAYALVSYQTAWLKTHYPAEFMAAVMSCEMAHPDSVVVMRTECLRMGLKVTPPDINRSRVRFTVPVDGEVLYGLGAIKGVGEAALEDILAQRDAGGAFTDLFDFCRRIDTRKANKRVLEALIFSGALDALGLNRASLFKTLPRALQVAEAAAQSATSGQDDLFGLSTQSGADCTVSVEPEIEPEWTQRELLQRERDTLGFYQSGHPIEAHAALIEQICSGRLDALIKAQRQAQPAAPAPAAKSGKGGKGGKQAWQPRTKALVAAWVKDLRFFKGDISQEGRGGRASYKVTLEDGDEEISCWIDADAFAKYQPHVKTDGLIFLICEVGMSPARDDRDPEPRLYAPEFFSLDQVMREYAVSLELEWARPLSDVMHLRRLLQSHRDPAGVPVSIRYANARAACVMELSGAWRLRMDDALLLELQQLLGAECAKVRYRQYVAPIPERRFAAASGGSFDDE